MFKWETQKERILRFMRISPKKKLEWLQEMQEFTATTSSRAQTLRRKLREIR